jgi:adenine-specific DNA-methyltransferase
LAKDHRAVDPRSARPRLKTLRTHGGASENVLVHGDNLVAMRALGAFEGKIRCAYLDPPFNSGRTFDAYDDALAPEDWEAMMRPRLAALRALMADDGAVFVEIDDTQLAALTLLLDATFGAENRISIITIVRSAATGHKAINRGPVHVSDFLLVYAKDRRAWKYRPQVSIRSRYDDAYGTWLDDPAAPVSKWTFRPLKSAAAKAFGHPTARAAVNVLGRETFAARVEAFALENPRNVVRFAQPRYEAIGKDARALVDRSRERPTDVLVLDRAPRPPFIVRGGNRVLFLADKVRAMSGRNVLVEPLTNVWTDVPFQGIAREGGVVFTRNKKPEKLVARVLEMASDPGDWIIDPFLGSGTTAAVAHKMGRRWIGIEAGAHAATLAEPRLVRVIGGEDRTGVTALYGFEGGGGFRVATIE